MPARYHLACLPGGDAQGAATCLAAHEGRIGAEERRSARWLPWRASGDRAHLAEAKRLLDEWVAQVDPEWRERVVTNRRMDREIAAAARANGL